MADLFENPMELQGFDFVEFTAPQKGILEPVFQSMGFSKVARHRSKDVDLWRQGEINLLTNYELDTPASFYAAEHGPSACAMGFRVKDAQYAYDLALSKGAEPVLIKSSFSELRLPAIRGIGGALIYLIDRFEASDSIYDIDFQFLDEVDHNPVGCGFNVIDHLTHNVYKGRMGYWAKYYEDLFNFREIRFFDIKGEYTGLLSKALTAPDGLIRIPLNEEKSEKVGQIEEYLREYKGEGIQHIAFSCDDLITCWDRLKAQGVSFMTAPSHTYYDMLEERLPQHGEPTEALRQRGILLDGSTTNEQPRLLLQIFSNKVIGPIFFEFIQRKEDDGFGEGNFEALFKSIERDQLSRGVFG
jgi:4-hydroxyphenylpyruvate dioxygenase